jgi:hypothetical protein
MEITAKIARNYSLLWVKYLPTIWNLKVSLDNLDGSKISLFLNHLVFCNQVRWVVIVGLNHLWDRLQSYLFRHKSIAQMNSSFRVQWSPFSHLIFIGSAELILIPAF